MAVASFLWGALLLLLQARASLAGGASEPAGQARLAARGERWGAPVLEDQVARVGVGVAREVTAWGRPKEEERWGRKEEKKTKREKRRKENEK
jgi:hypothetical protein